MESTGAFAMQNNNNLDEKDRVDYFQQYQERSLAKKTALDELYSNLEKYSETSGTESFLIDNISNYFEIYNLMLPDLTFSRAILYRKLKENRLAVADLRTTIKLAQSNKYNDTKAVLGLTKIYFESGRNADAINTLENAKNNSSFRTEEDKKILDYYIQQCKTNSTNKNS